MWWSGGQVGFYWTNTHIDCYQGKDYNIYLNCF
jgi:hypothetical protein